MCSSVLVIHKQFSLKQFALGADNIDYYFFLLQVLVGDRVLF